MTPQDGRFVAMLQGMHTVMVRSSLDGSMVGRDLFQMRAR